MKNRVAYFPISIIIFLFFFCTFSCSKKAPCDCNDFVETVKGIESFIHFIPPQQVIDQLTPPINSLRNMRADLTEECKYWLGSALRYRSDFGYAKMGLSVLGLEDCLIGLSVFQEMPKDKYLKEKAYFHNAIGIYYQSEFNLDASLYHSTEAFRIFSDLVSEAPALERDINNILASMGISYFYAQDLPNCEVYTKKAFAGRKNFVDNNPEALLIDELIIANSHFGMGLMFELKANKTIKDSPQFSQNIDSSAYHINKCIEILEKNQMFSIYAAKNSETLAKIYHHAANLYVERFTDQLNIAEELISKSKKYHVDAYPDVVGQGKIIEGKLLVSKDKVIEGLESIQAGLKYLVKDFSSTTIYENPDIFNSLITNKIALLGGLQVKAKSLEKKYKLSNNIEDLENSFLTFQLAIELLDELQYTLPYDFSMELSQRKFSKIYSQGIDVIIQLYEITQDTSYLEELFYLAEKSKSAVLKRSVRKKDILREAPSDSKEKKLLERESFLSRRIAFNEKLSLRKYQLNALPLNQYSDSILFYKNQLFTLQNEINANYPKLYQSQYQPVISGLPEVQNSLDNQTAFIEYINTENHLLILAVTSNDIQLIKAPNKQTWDPLVSNYINSLKVGLENDFISSASSLYEILLKEVLEKKLNPKIDRLVMIPDDRLRNIPFGTLLQKEVTKEEGYQDFPYVIRKYAISYDFTITSGVQSEKNRRKRLNFPKSICGFSTRQDDQLVLASKGTQQRRCSNIELEGTKKVLDSISIIFSKKDVEYATTKRIFKDKAGLGRVLYVGAHGCLDTQNPHLSNILFTPTKKGEDADLSILEVYSFNLNAEHFMLTACFAADGILFEGEGLISLARAFYYAGINSLMTSLWEVDDETAPFLEVRYLRYLQEKNMPKDKALQLATLDYLNEFQEHPKFWGNFILIGNAAPVNF